MVILPAIDLKGGRVVRWIEGEQMAEIPYDRDPLARARTFRDDGAQWLHVVDMDRAFGTGQNNDAAVQALCRLDGLRVEIGGNLLDPRHVARAVEWGAARVVLGTKAAVEGASLEALVHAAGAGRAALAIDVRDGRPAVRGGVEPIAASVGDLVARAIGAGIAVIVHRDLARDGTLAGADLDGAARLVRDGLDVIAAGGVESLDAVRRAGSLGIAGLIVGRALYEGRFTLPQALACC